jgi:hypothetical protein
MAQPLLTALGMREARGLLISMDLALFRIFVAARYPFSCIAGFSGLPTSRDSC